MKKYIEVVDRIDMLKNYILGSAQVELDLEELNCELMLACDTNEDRLDIFIVNKDTKEAHLLCAFDDVFKSGKDAEYFRREVEFELRDYILQTNGVDFNNNKEDVVNHPSHYCQEGSMECIDEMILLFGKEETMAFCKLNAWKYRKRAMYKNGEEDMKKSDWYLNKYKELSEMVPQGKRRISYLES